MTWYDVDLLFFNWHAPVTLDDASTSAQEWWELFGATVNTTEAKYGERVVKVALSARTRKLIGNPTHLVRPSGHGLIAVADAAVYEP